MKNSLTAIFYLLAILDIDMFRKDEKIFFFLKSGIL